MKHIVIPTWMLIIYLCGKKSVSAGNISSILDCTYTCIYKNIKILKEENLVSSIERDKKSFNVVLTDKGKTIFPRIHSFFEAMDINETNIKTVKQKIGDE